MAIALSIIDNFDKFTHHSIAQIVKEKISIGRKLSKEQDGLMRLEQSDVSRGSWDCQIECLFHQAD